MQGYVQTFRPSRGCGTLVDELGRIHSFATRGGDFHGGDVVRFNLDTDALTDSNDDASLVSQIEVIQGGVDRLAATADPLVRELFSTIEMETTAR